MRKEEGDWHRSWHVIIGVEIVVGQEWINECDLVSLFWAT
jgi:hypothetical protein